jgi:hypothetical protein
MTLGNMREPRVPPRRRPAELEGSIQARRGNALAASYARGRWPIRRQGCLVVPLGRSGLILCTHAQRSITREVVALSRDASATDIHPLEQIKPRKCKFLVGSNGSGVARPAVK